MGTISYSAFNVYWISSSVVNTDRLKRSVDPISSLSSPIALRVADAAVPGLLEEQALPEET